MATKSRANARTRRIKRPDYAKKIGQPPGVLVHLGEIKTEHPAITLFEFDDSGLHEQRFASVLESRDYTPQHRVLWLNVYGLQEPEVMSEIGRRFGLHPLTLEDILNTHQRPKLDDYGNYLYAVARAWRANPETGEVISDQVSIVLGESFVLTFQEQPGGLFDPIRERLRKNVGAARERGPDYLAYSLLDAVVDRYFNCLDSLAGSVERVEDAMNQPRMSRLIGDINRLKHDTRELRRTVWPLREVVAGLQRADERFVRRSTDIYLRDVHDHIVQVVESLDSLRDATGDLLDLHLSLESQRLNVEVRALTVVSMLFMPATLISGIFGMNFHSIPWLERADGFWLAIGMMLFIASVMGLIFWRRQWLQST
ncbi:magnesium/cobalt transporter CorA [Niveibacterium umoris]